MDKSVAVIGGGIAGLVCAARLKQLNVINVTVFDTGIIIYDYRKPKIYPVLLNIYRHCLVKYSLRSINIHFVFIMFNWLRTYYFFNIYTNSEL